jgi:acetyl-CoA acetyltransferase
MTIDTACSSSIVAIRTACRSLVNGDYTAAIAGGVNIMSSPDVSEIFGFLDFWIFDMTLMTIADVHWSRSWPFPQPDQPVQIV